ncbi:MAG: LysM peptidoglycan-binding domain-containing protein [Endomicrobia bacterium]|nr:LysM peptidoglycan-binding domain-containing protein [Endomicrobiia bacterium]
MKNFYNWCYLIIVFSILFKLNLYTYTPTYSAEILRVNNAVAKEITVPSVFINPAWLSNLRSPEVMITYDILHPNLTDGTKFVNNTAGFVWKFYFGGVGVGVNQFGVKDWYIKDAFIFSYGGDFSFILPTLKIGVKLSYNQETYHLDEYMETNPVFSSGNKKEYFGISIGCIYNLSKIGKFSVLIENLNQPDTGMYTKDILPLSLTSGVEYKYKKFKMYPTVKIELGEEINYDISLAVENDFLFLNNKIKFSPSIALGYGNREYNNVVLGFGLQTSQVSFHYGFKSQLLSNINTGAQQCISISYKFLPTFIEEEKVSKEEYEKLLSEKRQLEQQLQQIKKLPPTTTLQQTTSQEKASETKQEQTLTSEEILLKKIEELEKKLKETETKKTIIPPPTTPTPTQPSSSQPPVSKKRYHTVVAGDTLPKLAEKYYGDSSQWRKIYDANKDKIIRGQLIPGSVIEIP